MNKVPEQKILTINSVSTLKTVVMFWVLLGFGSIPSIFNVKLIDAFTLGSILLLMSVNRSYMMNRKLFKVTIGALAVAAVHMVITYSPITEYFSIFGRLIAMSLLITAFKNNYADIAGHLIKGLNIIAILAIINVVLYMTIPDLFTMVKTSSGFPINTIGLIFNYYSKIEFAGIVIPRNQGLFWEPGVLQIPMNILVYYRLIEQNRPFKSALLPIFVIFTTMSTTGFVIMAATFFFKLKSTFSLKGKGLLRTIGLLIVVAAFIPFLHSQIYNKLNKPGDNVSSMARTYDLIMATQIAIQHPVLGIGINPDLQNTLMATQNVEVDGFETEERGNTNTILQFFVNFGVPLSVILIIALYRQRLFTHRLAFFTLIMLSFFSEPLMGVFLMFLLMLSSLNLPQKTITVE